MTYEIDIERQAVKSMKRLDNTAAKRLTAAIDALTSEPRPHNCKALTGPYSGHYRLAITAPGGEYRVVYRIDDARNLVTVIAVGPRENIY